MARITLIRSTQKYDLDLWKNNSLLAKNSVSYFYTFHVFEKKNKLAKSKMNSHRSREVSLIAHSFLFTEQKLETKDASFSLKFLSVWKSHLNCWRSSENKNDIKNDEMKFHWQLLTPTHSFALNESLSKHDVDKLHFQKPLSSVFAIISQLFKVITLFKMELHWKQSLEIRRPNWTFVIIGSRCPYNCKTGH